MTLKPGQRSLERALAFKAYEIEELADVYFFRPLGAVIAHASRPVGISPTGLTVLGGIVGMAAGALMYWPSLGLLGFALLVLHSVLDSADGQLARLTNRTSELGRILDGVGGYATWAASYVAIAMGVVARGGGNSIFLWAVAAGICTALQAQLYDYHRSVYAKVALNARPPENWGAGLEGLGGRVARGYQAVQRLLIGRHSEVENAIRSRASDGEVPPGDRERYRRFFYWSVRRWNVLGDNTRIYAIGVFAFLRHLEWVFPFIVLAMSGVSIAFWAWQRADDRRFLQSLDNAKASAERPQCESR